MKKEVDNKEYLRKKMLISTKNYPIFVVKFVSSCLNQANSIDEIFDQMGISEKFFNMCLKKVKKEDINVYNSYLVERQKYDQKIIERIKAQINDLNIAINSGFFVDGVEFSQLELIKRLPFYNEKKPMYALHKFIILNMPEDGRCLWDYLGRNGLISSSYAKGDESFFLRQIINSKTVVNGREVSEEENNMIVSYMIHNHIPLHNKIYLFVRNLYLEGQIDLYHNIPVEVEEPLQRVLTPEDK